MTINQPETLGNDIQSVVNLILSRVKSARRTGDGYSFKCPAHDDKKSSAAFYPKSNGVAFKCYAGCTTEQICDGLGISKSDLHIRKQYYSRLQTVACYRYFDEAGRPLYEHHRLVDAAGKKPSSIAGKMRAETQFGRSMEAGLSSKARRGSASKVPVTQINSQDPRPAGSLN
jgi:hypothetical protein